MSQIDSLIRKFNKEYQDNLITIGLSNKKVDKIPFSSPRLNYMTYGGVPRGRLIEFAGEEGGGKTTTALDIVKQAQIIFDKEREQEVSDYRVLYIDCENTLDELWARKLGVNVDDLILLKPMAQTAEQVFEMAIQFIETGEIGLCIIDSLGVMLSAQAFEADLEKKTYGGISSPLTTFSKKAELSCAKTGCTLIGINQIRENLNSPYGGTITPGGRGWKHNCSMRLEFRKGSYIDDKCNEVSRSVENPYGNLVTVSLVKSKTCPPNRKNGFYTLSYLDGILANNDLLEVALKIGVADQSGAWISFNNLQSGEVYIFVDENGKETTKLQGKKQTLLKMDEDENFYNFIYNQVMKELDK